MYGKFKRTSIFKRPYTRKTSYVKRSQYRPKYKPRYTKRYTTPYRKRYIKRK